MILIILSYILLIRGYSSGNSYTVEDCGKASPAAVRIVGGNVSESGAYPWMVSLHEDVGHGFEHACGAAVLNENWVITAAHCITQRPSKYRILVGLQKQSMLNASTVQRLEVSKMVLHEDFDDDTFENDIALLKTATPIDIAGSNGYVNGICLPETMEEPTEYKYYKVIGWGLEHENGENTDNLKEVELPLIPRDLCNGVYDDDPYDGIDDVTKDMICAGKKLNKDSCQNDSGGPLFETNSEGVSTLIGIVSHGAGCGRPFYPGVYTKVSSYINWIKTVIKE